MRNFCYLCPCQIKLTFMDKRIDIRKLTINPRNPRTMSEFMEGKLIQSVLVFPRMLDLRPILANEDKVILGGNQRVTVLMKILGLADNEIEDYLLEQRKYRMASQESKDALLAFWQKWREKPVVPVRISRSATIQEIEAADDLFTDMLTGEDEMEMLTKDNMHYGQDDVDVLKREYDREAIEDYLGSVPWNMYDYDNNKINDGGVQDARTTAQTFKCGYIECIITNEEKAMLDESLDRYLEQHDGKSDGFLTYLLNYNLEAA